MVALKYVPHKWKGRENVNIVFFFLPFFLKFISYYSYNLSSIRYLWKVPYCISNLCKNGRLDMPLVLIKSLFYVLVLFEHRLIYKIISHLYDIATFCQISMTWARAVGQLSMSGPQNQINSHKNLVASGRRLG